MRSRREFIQLATVSAMLLATKPWNSVAAKQKLKTDDLLDFESKGQVTLLHLTDMHGQLNPVFYRPPSENFGVGKFEGIPPHLVGEAFLERKWRRRHHMLLLSVVIISWRLAGPITLATPVIAIAVRCPMRRTCARRRAAGLVVVLRSIAVYSGSACLAGRAAEVI